MNATEHLADAYLHLVNACKCLDKAAEGDLKLALKMSTIKSLYELSTTARVVRSLSLDKPAETFQETPS